MATSASGIYSETLQSIVDAKLAELQRKRSTFEQSKTKLLDDASNKLSDIDKVKTLTSGVKSLFGIRSSNGYVVHGSSKNHELEQKLANLERFLAQPQYDPSISMDMLCEWEQDLLQQLDVQSNRFEYASLYAQLVTEWLAAEKKIPVKREPDEDTDMEISNFEELESKQVIEAREKWAADVFEPRNTDPKAIQSYLNELFGKESEKKQTMKALNALRRKVTTFSNSLSQPNQFDEHVLRWVIKGLLKTDLLTEDKRNVLRDFLSNSVILNELADVLNLRLFALDTWSWGESVRLEQKRKIQGHFAIIMHEDLLQAIFLQYIGVKWSVFFRQAFTEFIQHDGAWVYTSDSIPLDDLKRRDFFLGRQDQDDSLEAKRLGFWQSCYFMCQLPLTERVENEVADGEFEANLMAEQAPQQQMMQQQMMQQSAQQSAQSRHMVPGSARTQARMGQSLQSHQTALMTLEQQNRKRLKMARQDQYNAVNNVDEFEGIKRPKNPTQAKQVLLHLLSSDILINNHLYGNLTAFRGQYERWNPLLPHSTIWTVMQYLGVPPRWLKFFKVFLEAPLSFADEEEVHHRKRGVPGNHAISDILGEVILFCLDIKVNQATKGARLWRVHDDFWFWSKDHDTTTTAWETIQEFSSIMGLTLDMNKSGSVRTGTQAGQVGTSLPPGNIRWGFLTLNSASGRFEIDQAAVDRHVSELQRQLNAKDSSVFSWIEAWNAYANTFFTTNFGKSANCFGQQHIDEVLSTLERAQRALFRDGPSTASSVVEYLKQTLASRFDIQSVPEGYVFFPSALGGLELRNPFVLLLQLRNHVTKNPQQQLEKFTEEEKEQYKYARLSFEKGQIARNVREYPDYTPADSSFFMSFDEYIRYRETFAVLGSRGLSTVFTELMHRPDSEATIDASSEIMTALNLMDTGGVVGQEGECGINGNWYGMEPYWKWILGVYGPQMLRKFGGLNIVDNGVLPIGMVSLFRSQGVSWRG